MGVNCYLSVRKGFVVMLVARFPFKETSPGPILVRLYSRYGNEVCPRMPINRADILLLRITSQKINVCEILESMRLEKENNKSRFNFKHFFSYS